MRLTFAIIPLVFISCLPNRLVPYDFSIEKNNIEAYIELDSITIAIANLKVERDHFVFGMSIENNSDQSIFVDLKKIKKYANQVSYKSAYQQLSFQEVTTAMTPRQVNQFFKAKKNSADGAAFLLLLVGAAITTYDMVQDHKDSKKDTWTRSDQKQSATRDLVTTTALIATEALSEAAAQSSVDAETELQYLPKELFNREVIYPGEHYYGKILFKKVGTSKDYHRITIPHEGKRFHFDFRKATPKEKQFLFDQ